LDVGTNFGESDDADGRVNSVKAFVTLLNPFDLSVALFAVARHGDTRSVVNRAGRVLRHRACPEWESTVCTTPGTDESVRENPYARQKRKVIEPLRFS